MHPKRLFQNRALPVRHSAANPVVPAKSGWLDFFIRHAGSVAVDHTHLLPLNTLEAELKARQSRPRDGECC